MSRLASYALIVFIVALLASCANRYVEAERLWTLAVSKLNEGDIQGGIQDVRNLRWYDRNKSAYLLGQYMVFGAASRGGLNFTMGMDRFYKDVLAIEVKPNDPYIRQISASKLFAMRWLEGESHAMAYSKEVCIVFHHVPSSCIAELVSDAEEKYLSDPSVFNALYLYQAADVGRDLDTANTDEADFLMSLALLKMNDRGSASIVNFLSMRRAFTVQMLKRYCQLAKELQLDAREPFCAMAK
jgi:hypothetical protein